tara:strand:+ start:430 stop:870 length:441 start_codon:yes stop_codon:yes gene_type:complete
MKKILILIILSLFCFNITYASLFKSIKYYNCSGRISDQVKGKKINWNGMRYIGLEKEKIYFWWNGKDFLQEKELVKTISKTSNDEILTTNFFIYGKNEHNIKLHVNKVRSKKQTLVSFSDERSDTVEGYELIAFLSCEQIRKNQLK